MIHKGWLVGFKPHNNSSSLSVVIEGCNSREIVLSTIHFLLRFCQQFIYNIAYSHILDVVSVVFLNDKLDFLMVFNGNDALALDIASVFACYIYSVVIMRS